MPKQCPQGFSKTDTTYTTIQSFGVILEMLWFLKEHQIFYHQIDQRYSAAIANVVKI